MSQTAMVGMLLVFGLGAYISWAYWATIVAQAGSWYSSLRSWVVGVSGGTGATAVAVYTRYIDGVLTPALNALEGLFYLDFGTMYEWSCVFVIIGTQLLPIIIVTYNLIMYGQPVIENMPHGERQKRAKKAKRYHKAARNHGYRG